MSTHIQISEQQIQVVRNVLAAGSGIAAACKVINVHPRSFSNWLLIHEKEMKELQSSVMAGYTAITSQLIKATKEGKPNAMKALSEQERRFVKRLVMWGDSSQGDRPTLLECLRAMDEFHGNKEEAAVSVGMEHDSFIAKLNNGDAGEVMRSYIAF